MTQKRFGSVRTTGKKLDVIAEYLSMYQKTVGGKFKTAYIDGFAGSGEVPLTERKDDLFDKDVQTVISGSADRALNVTPPFNRYVFIDNRKKCIEALKSKFKHSPNALRANYLIGDANECIQNICKNEQWRYQRGVVLLDPFGSQVEWKTIEIIAATQALDLWYLFPAGVGVFRQISNDGTVHNTHESSITRLYGTDTWKEAFLEPSKEPDLFDAPITHEKVVTPESAALFMIERMKGIFKGGILDVMIPLGKHAYPSYYLLFAWGNASPKTKTLANTLAKAAITAIDRKNGRII